VVAAGGGDDTVFGGGGNDKICGEAGFDTIQGGPGNDAMDAGSAGGGVDYGPTSGPVTVNLATGQASGEGTDILTNFSEVYGSQYNDNLIGRDDNTGLEFLAGEGGNDQLSSGAGNDRVDGGSGNDQIDGGAGADALNGDQGGDTILSRDSTSDAVTCGTETDSVTADALDSIKADCEHVELPEDPKPPPLPPPPPPVSGKPDTEILHLEVRSAAHRATIRFSGSGEAAPLHFLCKLDRGSFVPCVSPKVYRRLKVGSHTVQVIAVDSNGSADPAPAKSSFTVKRPRKRALHKKRIFALLLGYRYRDSNQGLRN
jgi:Ca2+-binding RTX toxin-like protein